MAGHAIGFKLLGAAAVAWLFGGKSTTTKSGGSGTKSLTHTGDLRLTASAVGADFVKDTLGISVSDDTGSRVATVILSAAEKLFKSLTSGLNGFITLLFAEIGFFVTLFMSDQKMLQKGRTGAVNDLINFACGVRDRVYDQAKQLGVDDAQAHCVAIAFAWTCAMAYNQAAYKYIANYDLAGGLEGIGRAVQSEKDHENYWCDRAMFVPLDKMNELGSPPFTTQQPVSVFTPGVTVAVTTGADARLFNHPMATYAAQAIQNAGALWSGDLYKFANALGTFMWCSNGLISAWDNAWQSQGAQWPSNAGGWFLFGHGDAAHQAFYWYTQSGILDSNYVFSDADGGVHHTPTGLIWLAEATWKNGKPQISYAASS